jgi:hypothetical protein
LSFPLLRALAGIVFLLAGLFVYYRIPVGPLGLALVIAGVVVIAIPLLGHRPQGGDVALFIIALIVLAASTGAYSYRGMRVAVFSAPATAFHVNRVDLSASTNLGSIAIESSTNSDLAYSVTFTTSPVFGLFPFATNYTLTNETRGGVLFLNASSSAASISVTLGPSYVANINASANTGSVDLSWAENVTLGDVSLSSNTGSVDANLVTSGIRSLSMTTNTGSVDLRSSYLAPGAARVPLTLSTNTGSVSLNVRIPSTSAMTIDASTSIGSVSHGLQGFTVSQSSTNNRLSATYGEMSMAADSFVVSASTSTGSVSLKVQTS